MFWECLLGGLCIPKPPPAPASDPTSEPTVDFQLLDEAPESGAIDVTQVSDHVETKLNSLCKSAEVHVPHFVL